MSNFEKGPWLAFLVDFVNQTTTKSTRTKLITKNEVSGYLNKISDIGPFLIESRKIFYDNAVESETTIVREKAENFLC